MGNVSGNINDLGTQAGNAEVGIGEASSEIQLVGSYIFGGFLILIGIACIIYALIPTPQFNCKSDDEKLDADEACTPILGKVDQPACDSANAALALKKQQCAEKTRKYIFLLGGLCIPLAILMIWYAIWWNKKTHESRGFAQLGGLSTTANLMNIAFHRR
jgi:hypothetical protein